MILMKKMRLKKRKYLAADPDMRGKKVYILYKFDMKAQELVSDGPFLNKNDAYNKMQESLGKGVCSWVVVYNE